MSERPLMFYENYRGCWVCHSHRTTTTGYIRINRDGNSVLLHRYMYEKHTGRIPRGLCVLHKCDNRKCGNPNHLFLGTKADNDRDRDEKNRQAKGVTNGRALLTAPIVRAIYHEPGSSAEVAQRYGISHQHVRQIKTKRRWRHLWEIKEPKEALKLTGE